MYLAPCIIAFGYHDQTAPRHWNTTRMLREEGWNIVECHTEASGLWGKYLDLWKKFCQARNEERGTRNEVLVTFPGHYLVPLAWVLTRWPRRRLIFDVFVSLSDTDVSDRHRVSWAHPWAWFLYLVDFVTTHLADEVWIDTEAHKQFFTQRFLLRPSRIRVIYVGTREDLFHPQAYSLFPKSERYEVLFYGTYIPLQGIEYILEAAARLQTSHPQIHFTLIGKGQTYPAMRKCAEELHLGNVTFEDPVLYRELTDRIRASDLCLGIFGTSGKAQRVIPHKVFDAVASGVPVITARSPAILEKFTDGREVTLCNPGDPSDLAGKILSLYYAQQR